jgi:hypothetical protein
MRPGPASPRSYRAVAPHMRQKNLPYLNDDDGPLRDSLRMVLNHYEFISAGIRNGDLDETLIRDSERGTILNLFEGSRGYIDGLRTTRRRRATFEHLEWLHKRWETNPPGFFKRCFERARGRPLKGRTERVRE